MTTNGIEPKRADATEPSPRRRIAGLIVGPLLFCFALLLPAPAGMAPEAWRMTAVTAWVVVWWLSEAVPIPATALLPLVLMPLLGIRAISPTASEYANPLIFLLLGGFLLAAAMQKVGLHRRIALRIISFVGMTPDRIVLGFMLATAFMSMWISNTATTIMMFAVALSVIEFVDRQTPDKAVVRNFGVALMLSIAYSASIGGMGTLIGTPPNALLASYLLENHGIEITFAGWMTIGIPVVLTMLPLAWLILTRILFPARTIAITDAGHALMDDIDSLGRMDSGERFVALVFAVTALSWIFSAPLTRLTGLPLNDTTIAVAAALVLFAVPVARGATSFALDWSAAHELPWGILILFGGGLALAAGFETSGLAAWIATVAAGADVNSLLLIFIAMVATAALSEVASNTASTATFLPILAAIATGLDLDLLMLTVPVTLAASTGFMLPVATPPNAIVFGYEKLQVSDMVRAGFLFDVLGVSVIFLLFVLLGPWALGFAF